MNILMVCLGNICRSPLAQGILEKKIAALGLDWKVDSAGTGGWHVGNAPDTRSIEVGLAHNIDIRQQKARKLRGYDLEEFDLIFAMDSSNFIDITRLAQDDLEKAKVKLILNESVPGMNQAVPDPYYGGDNGFENVFQMIDKACDQIIDNYR